MLEARILFLIAVKDKILISFSDIREGYIAIGLQFFKEKDLALLFGYPD